MKFIIVFSVMFSYFSAANADWICKAYCPDEQWSLMVEHAEHPVEALNQIVQRCALSLYGEDKKSEVALFIEESTTSEKVTIENSCQLLDFTSY